MKLTKAQRHKVYKEAKRIHIDSEGKRPHFFLCCAIRSAMCILFDESPNDVEILNWFPEFASKKPVITDSFSTAWWKRNEHESRIKAINKCIRETAPKRRKK